MWVRRSVAVLIAGALGCTRAPSPREAATDSLLAAHAAHELEQPIDLNARQVTASADPRRDSIFAAELTDRSNRPLLLNRELGGWIGSLDSVTWLDSTYGLSAHPEIRGLAGAFWHANHTRTFLAEPPAIPGRRIRLVPGEIPEVDAGGRYVTTLSLPAFTANGDSALASISTYCGPLCGSFEIALYARVNGVWTQVRTIAFGIS